MKISALTETQLSAASRIDFINIWTQTRQLCVTVKNRRSKAEGSSYLAQVLTRHIYLDWPPFSSGPWHDWHAPSLWKQIKCKAQVQWKGSSRQKVTWLFFLTGRTRRLETQGKMLQFWNIYWNPWSRLMSRKSKGTVAQSSLIHLLYISQRNEAWAHKNNAPTANLFTKHITTTQIQPCDS